MIRREVGTYYFRKIRFLMNQTSVKSKKVGLDVKAKLGGK